MKKTLCLIIFLMLISAGMVSATVITRNIKPSSESISFLTYKQENDSNQPSNDLPSVFFYEDTYDVFIGDDFTFSSTVVNISNAEYIQWFTTNGGGGFDNETNENPTYFPSPSIDYPQGYTIIGVAASNAFGDETQFVQLNYINFTSTPGNINPIPPLDCEVPTVEFSHPYYNVTADSFTFNDDIVLYGTIEDIELVQWITTTGGGVFDSETILYPTYTPGVIDYMLGYAEIGVVVAGCGGNDDAFTTLILLNQPPVADFSYSPESPEVGDLVEFTDLSDDSDGDIVEWSWIFGDGASSSDQHPSHVYDSADSYLVTLTVTDDDGASDSISEYVIVSEPYVNQPPVADFSYSPMDPEVGDTVQFTDLSSDPDGFIVSWLWSFGDENTSTQQHPSHVYSSEGTYTVTLTVTDDDGDSDSISMPITVHEPYVNNPPLPPSNPSPEDGSIDVDVDVILSWECSDPDEDPLTYDVYFGTSTPLQKVEANQTDDFYNPGGLEYSTTYYWKIVAWDDKNAFTEGNVWEFTTKQGMANLDCEGSLQWSDVKPGDTVTGTFTVMNVGDPQSLLDWEIEYHPCWGSWSFTPQSGSGLTPEDGELTVSVEVVAPSDKNKEFSGKIVLVNSNDGNDTCQIDIALATPQNHAFPLLQRILQRFPNLFPILRYILGL
jgi:PKD repeat protein